MDSSEEEDEDEDFMVGACRDRTVESTIVMMRTGLFFRVCEPDSRPLGPFELSDI